MKKFVVISGSGPDQVGLVDKISNFLSERNLNIEDSRMAVLGGDFALILLVSGEEEEINWLEENISRLAEDCGLNLTLRETRSPEERKLEKVLPYKMVVSGMDHPGIVHQFTSILHRYQVNIESMESRVYPAPLSGTPIFVMECRVSVPASVKLAELKSELAHRAEEENLDLEFEPLELG